MNAGVDLGLEGRSYVVGGGSRGLGRAVADVLVAEGARAVLLGRGEGSLGDAVRELGPSTFACPVDIAAPDAPPAVERAVEEHLDGRLDGMLVTASFFPTLGVAPVLGRS